MSTATNIAQWILGFLLILSSIGVILVRKPIHASLCFLLTLLLLAAIYIQLAAPFIAVMQVIVYAGAILVIFVFVIVLFQDAHQQIEEFRAKSSPILLWTAAVTFLASLGLLAWSLMSLPAAIQTLPAGYGTVETLGKALYIDFFFPFEAIILLFLVAIVGALYIGKKEI